jgi:hypothetical protein
MALTVNANAAERFVVVITGASGGEAYARRYDEWRNALVATLKERLQYADDRLFVLADSERNGPVKPTRENIRRTFAALRTRLSKDDLLFVILIGHGTVEEDEGKFNLVGPDMSSAEWRDVLKTLPGRLVFVNTAGGSFPFLARLAAPGRIVVTATDTAAQQFETIFPEFFVKALDDPAADTDKNGRVSVWEAFADASAAVRRRFDQQGQLPTERSLLDDTGDGTGREAQNPGPDGLMAQAVYFAPETPGAAGDPGLLKRRAELQRQLDDLRLRKASSPDSARYDAEIEAVLLEIARISRQTGGR